MAQPVGHRQSGNRMLERLAELTSQEARTGAARVPYQLDRVGILMRPEMGNEAEEGGVLNPGGARARDGSYLLFPRLVAAGNYSRIGIARVCYTPDGLPSGVERLGLALEPREAYELNTLTGGGVEDPRVVYVPLLGLYVMTYVAFGPHGPRAALAISNDLFSWTRLGLIDFAPLQGADMNLYANKDHVLFPEPVPGPDGRPCLALLHRPMFQDVDLFGAPFGAQPSPPVGLAGSRWSVWISYCPLDRADWAVPGSIQRPWFGDHHLLLAPEHEWEASRLGAGTPPVLVPEGWLEFYHGVQLIYRADGSPGLRYSAAAALLDAADPRKVLYRSPTPTLEPLLPEETSGVVSNVVFPTAIDQHASHLDVYYGMADRCIGAARLSLPVPRA
jgi:predicted GH43/DUF377 family glycosyl hydrolase